MKNSARIWISALLLLLFCFTLTGCQAIGDIFGAGVYVGVFMVVIVVIIILVIVSRFRNKP